MGARLGAGRPADPNALRRDRKDDAEWTTLPAEGRSGPVPAFPLDDPGSRELAMWDAVWLKPQAVMWSRLGLEHQVAAYCRAFIESTSEKASAGLKTAVLRMEGELGISIPGMNSYRWKFAEDELGAKRAPVVPRAAVDMKSRLAAVGD